MDEKIRQRIREGVLRAIKQNPQRFKLFKGHSPETMARIKPKISATLTTHGKYTLIRKLKNIPCHRCGNKKAFLHHKNGNQEDNKSKNVEKLCRSCHVKEHYKIGTKTRYMGRATVKVLC